MFSRMPRPSRTAATMVAKLSSARIILPASLVTSVPVMPMAMPMSADLRAGASLTPSPVMATTAPPACRASTMRSLCTGATRANTAVVRTATARAGSSIASSAWPVSTGAPAAWMPRSTAMRAAVRGWSPVIITMRMPARWASAIAGRTSVRGGSMMPTEPA